MTTCPYCKKLFTRNRSWQKTCGKSKCVEKHRAKLMIGWRDKHPEYHKKYMIKYNIVIMKGEVR